MAVEWDIREPASRCTRCGNAFEAGEEVFSALAEEGESFARIDSCAGCWGRLEAATFFSRWRTVTPARDEPIARRMSAEVVLDFFHRLEGETDRRKVCFRYVLALMLMRKKVMRLNGVERGNAFDALVLEYPRAGGLYRVTDPHLNSDEIAGLTEEVGRLLNVRPDGAESEAADAPDPGAPEASALQTETAGDQTE